MLCKQGHDSYFKQAIERGVERSLSPSTSINSDKVDMKCQTCRWGTTGNWEQCNSTCESGYKVEKKGEGGKTKIASQYQVKLRHKHLTSVPGMQENCTFPIEVTLLEPPT